MAKLTSALKKKLHSHCVSVLEDKIEELRSSMEAVQNAANDEAKSSMGDKYETNREMMHAEKEKLGQQYSHFTNLLNSLKNVRHDTKMTEVQPGALVETNKGVFYFTVPLVKEEFNGETYFILSINSPIGQKLLGLKKGEKVSLNGKSFEVKNVI